MHMIVDTQMHITLGSFQWTVWIAPRYMRDHCVARSSVAALDILHALISYVHNFIAVC